LKNFFVRILYLALVLSAPGFAGCGAPLEPPRKTPAIPGKGSVAVSIAGAAAKESARTIAPGIGGFTKYTLTFSGPEAHDPVDINIGSSVTVELWPGSWTIGAAGYTGTAGSYVEAAEGSARVNVVEGEIAPVSILLGPKSTAAGTGSFSYSITLPGGASGSLRLATAEGGAVAGGTLALSAGTNTGAQDLAPGHYLARLRLEKGGDYAGFTEALHVYSGLTSVLSPRTYTDSDFTAVPIADQVMAPLAGVWYSKWDGIRQDGYRMGKWKDFDALMGVKVNLFPNLQRFTYTSQTGSNVPGADDYFVFYDDTVYGEGDNGEGGSGGWGVAYRFIGIVRAVNIFDGDPDRGAIIVEYLRGCAPQWDEDIKDGQRPFFGIYYKKTGADTVQLANPVDLNALSNGEKYYTETAALQEAIDKNTAANEGAFISWGVVIPQEREQ
jgi:hypothetical protein